MKKEKETHKEKHDEFKDRYIRILADYQNLSNRLDDEKQKAIDYANENFMRDLIGILNDIEIALSHIEDDGMKKILEKLLNVLKKHGLNEIEIIEGETEFNPEFHEAIETREGKDNLILKVYRKGYLLNNKLIQSAVVAVGKDNSL